MGYYDIHLPQSIINKLSDAQSRLTKLQERLRVVIG